MKRVLLLTAIALAVAPAMMAPAAADPLQLPFFPTPLVPSRTPLAFGMTPEDVATALGTTLVYVRGTPGNEVRVASLPGDGALFPRGDRIYLQFRKGQLTAWKGDWSIEWVGP